MARAIRPARRGGTATVTYLVEGSQQHADGMYTDGAGHLAYEGEDAREADAGEATG